MSWQSFLSLTLSGGAFGILGRKADGETSLAPLLITRARIAATGQGVFGNFSEIKVQDTMIAHTEWNGLCVLEAESVDVLNSLISDTEAVGLLLFNTVPGSRRDP